MTDDMFEMSWDRGKKTREETKQLDCFEFKCEACGSKELDLMPVGVPWLHDGFKKGLPAKYVKALKTHAKPLLEAISLCTEVSVSCESCSTGKMYIKARVRDEQVRKWYADKFNDGGFDLKNEGTEHEETTDEKTREEETVDN